MRDWALIENNVVINIIVLDMPDIEEERQWITSNWNATPFPIDEDNRPRFLDIGSTYDQLNNRFIPVKPEGDYTWDEENLRWILTESTIPGEENV